MIHRRSLFNKIFQYLLTD